MGKAVGIMHTIRVIDLFMFFRMNLAFAVVIKDF